MVFAAVPTARRGGTLGCLLAVASSTRTWTPSFPWLLWVPLPLPPLPAAAAARIAAVDTGWNPAALGTLEVPKIAVALACWQLRPLATARKCHISAVESQ